LAVTAATMTSARPPSAFSVAADRRRLGGECVFRKNRSITARNSAFLGFEVMVQRLPRQPCGLGRLPRSTKRRKTLAAEHRDRGVEDTGTGIHLTIFDKIE